MTERSLDAPLSRDPQPGAHLFDAAQVAELHAPSAGGARMPIASRLARMLRATIVDGSMKTGESFPPERELAAQLQVSRDTVRRAIEELIRQGLVEARQGAGTFVAARVEQPLTEITSFSDDMLRRGFRPGSHWVKRELRRPTPEESLALGLAPDSVVMHLERVRTADAVPMAIERAVLAADLLGGNLEFGDSLYGALNAAGICPVKALQRLRAELASAPDADLLGIRGGDPVLHIERRSFSVEGRPLELTRSFYRGDRYDYLAVMGKA
ncbi:MULTISPECIES: GntR family transcriptional regulator [Burkholderia]|uniref:GntR family transcriptional regulator n=1 Tax=Burkholderia TaxID=32008 RepID=UPI0009BE325E|nr:MULTISPECIES: GntR family transcriptional regulator [Burkholderia]MCA8356450.1 GntR family transcriptional regulator [Burkholderia cepacia]HDR9762399.1 GntR family transcriptional regulator [Burkholderia cepacia ATCC 25416]